MGDDYIDDIRQRQRILEHDIERTRRRADTGTLGDRVTAKGELAELEHRHKELAGRLAEAEKRDAGDWSDTHRGLREELDGIGEALERWTTRHLSDGL